MSRLLQDCEKLPVIKYLPVTAGVELPVDIASNFSTDQKYLLQICHAVATGQCPQDLADKKPGKLHNARWLTKASRILRLYIATSKPNVKLKSLVEFIMEVYAPVWFAIRKNPDCFMGSKHQFLMIKLSRSLPNEVRNVIDPVIQNNAYFAHCENVLLSMMMDDNLETRIEALRLIKSCRSKPETDVRRFNVPKINFEATEYTEMIEWDVVTEPPIIKNIPNKGLEDLVMTNSPLLKKILDFPCHTQAVERHVAMVTEAVAAQFNPQDQDARVRSRLESRSAMPTFRKKSDWNVSDSCH